MQLLPLARELRTTMLGRDNVVQTKGDDIYAKAVEDLREKGVESVASVPDSIDSTLAKDEWWSSTIENVHDVNHRVSNFVSFLSQQSTEDEPLVVVTHSNFLRQFFRAHSSSSGISSSLTERLGREKVENCAVLAIRIDPSSTDGETENKIIQDARFLFGTGFRRKRGIGAQ